MQGGKWPVHKTISFWVIMLASKINPSTPLQSANRSSLNFDAPKEGNLKDKRLKHPGAGRGAKGGVWVGSWLHPPFPS